MSDNLFDEMVMFDPELFAADVKVDMECALQEVSENFLPEIGLQIFPLFCDGVFVHEGTEWDDWGVWQDQILVLDGQEDVLRGMTLYSPKQLQDLGFKQTEEGAWHKAYHLAVEPFPDDEWDTYLSYTPESTHTPLTYDYSVVVVLSAKRDEVMSELNLPLDVASLTLDYTNAAASPLNGGRLRKQLEQGVFATPVFVHVFV